jgi:CheY-like chemotaxis protein
MVFCTDIWLLAFASCFIIIPLLQRTPLHQVIGFIQLLNETKLEPEQERFVQLMHSSSQSLMAVINDLLDYTKLEAGKMPLEIIKFNPIGVIDGTLAAVECKALQNEVTLIKKASSSDIPSSVFGDSNRLRQILLNLLSNAIKFTEKGQVTLSACKIGADETSGNPIIRFMVEDNGIGISPENQEVVFQKYKQANAAIARNFGGTGLGLPICEQLAMLMGGSIHVESELGKGSKFWVDLPFEVSDSEMTFNASSTSGNLHLSQSDLQSSLRILVAEDNKVNQKLVNAMLRRMGHEVTIVPNGQQAVDRLDKEQFDAILMDVQMPVLDGIQSTKEIRKKGLKTPIIGLTASYQRSDVDFYRDIGMDECISKPVLMQNLKETLWKSTMNCMLQEER